MIDSTLKAVLIGYKRGLENQHENTSIHRIVDCYKKGRKLLLYCQEMYVYNTEKTGHQFQAVKRKDKSESDLGKIMYPHGCC